MVVIVFDPEFRKKLDKINNIALRDNIKTHLIKIRNNPEIGKPMRYGRKGTREIYISSFRLSYLIQGDTINVLDLYHKDGQ